MSRGRSHPPSRLLVSPLVGGTAGAPMLFEISSPASGRLLDLVDQWSKRYPEDLPLRRALRGLLADLHADPALIELDSEALEAIRSRAADLLAAFPDDRELVLIDAALTAAV